LFDKRTHKQLGGLPCIKLPFKACAIDFSLDTIAPKCWPWFWEQSPLAHANWFLDCGRLIKFFNRRTPLRTAIHCKIAPQKFVYAAAFSTISGHKNASQLPTGSRIGYIAGINMLN